MTVRSRAKTEMGSDGLLAKQHFPLMEACSAGQMLKPSMMD